MNIALCLLQVLFILYFRKGEFLARNVFSCRKEIGNLIFWLRVGQRSWWREMRHENGLYAMLLCPGDIKNAVFKANKGKKLLRHEKYKGTERI